MRAIGVIIRDVVLDETAQVSLVPKQARFKRERRRLRFRRPVAISPLLFHGP
jgi:hypothetical protein